VVSAASIVAKVNRDRTLYHWDYKENVGSLITIKNNKRLDVNFGCGYPSDPKTKKWMEKNCDHVFGYPSLVRFSWKTTTNSMKGKIKQIKWENFDENQDASAMSNSCYNQTKIDFSGRKAKKKNDYLGKNKLKIKNFKIFK
jgi:ribonuclease H2 subunit A